MNIIEKAISDYEEALTATGMAKERVSEKVERRKFMFASANGTIFVANAVIVKGGKILVVRKGKHWILPGGKVEHGESLKGCLRREVSEELSGTSFFPKERIESIHSKSLSKEYEIIVTPFLGEVQGEVGNVTENDSIEESAWVTLSTTLNLSEATREVLKNKRIIKAVEESW